MQLLPCQLQPEQASALTNTFPGVFPARPIMTGRMALDLLLIPIAEPAVEPVAFDSVHAALSWRDGAGRVHEVVCPLGGRGTQLWLQEPMQVYEVFSSAIRVIYQQDRQGRMIYLTGGERRYTAGETMLTPRIEWARPDRLLVRDVGWTRLYQLTEEHAKRAGAAKAAVMGTRSLPGASHLSGLRVWWANWHGPTAWADRPDRAVWLVYFERTFAEDPA